MKGDTSVLLGIKGLILLAGPPPVAGVRVLPGFCGGEVVPPVVLPAVPRLGADQVRTAGARRLPLQPQPRLGAAERGPPLPPEEGGGAGEWGAQSAEEQQQRQPEGHRPPWGEEAPSEGGGQGHARKAPPLLVGLVTKLLHSGFSL